MNGEKNDLTGLSELPFEPSPPASDTDFPSPEPTLVPRATSVDPIAELRQGAEQVIPGKAQVAAAFPFSLLIEGPLAENEKARLLELLARENMGVREVDLEPQLQAGRILIPRISEYAGVMLVQALRGARAELRLGPSDTIFATPDTKTRTDEDFELADPKRLRIDTAEPLEADLLTLSIDPPPPGTTVVDTVTASAALRTFAIEAHRSDEFQETLEALQRELKHKAHHHGATSIARFTVQLLPLKDPSSYRLLVTGLAVKTLP